MVAVVGPVKRFGEHLVVAVGPVKRFGQSIGIGREALHGKRCMGRVVDPLKKIVVTRMHLCCTRSLRRRTVDNVDNFMG